MSNTINYAEQYTNQLRELYGQESKADALYHSNSDIRLRGGKTIKIPIDCIEKIAEVTGTGSRYLICREERSIRILDKIFLK